MEDFQPAAIEESDYEGKDLKKPCLQEWSDSSN